jgi:hypothetical protein
VLFQDASLHSARCLHDLEAARFPPRSFVAVRTWPGTLALSSLAYGGEIHSCTVVSLSAFRSAGNIHAQAAVITNVPIPPKTTAGTVPNKSAVRPDSN